MLSRHGSLNRQRGYYRWSAPERVNLARSHGFGFEQHLIGALAKAKSLVGFTPMVMMAVPLGHLKVARRRHLALCDPTDD